MITPILKTRKYELRLVDPTSSPIEIANIIENHPYLTQFGATVELELISGDVCELTINIAEEGTGGPFGSAVRIFVENETGEWLKSRYDSIDDEE